MNYRHAFHAGNFADVFKHLLLSRMLVYLGLKATPFRYIDTHAGIGRYDLAAAEASRTLEWRGGIGRLLRAPRPPQLEILARPYLDAVGAHDEEGRPASYPGSPAVAQRLLRTADRLLLAELHPDDAVALRRNLGRDRRIKVLERDGYEVLGAAVPPPERRGLVLIDPPFEARDEFDRLGAALAVACRKWATGTFAIWYPVKDRATVAGFYRGLRNLDLPPTCRLELSRDATATEVGLRGCGLLVVNPPYVLAEEARQLLPFLASVLSGPGEPAFHATIGEIPTRP